jgi:homoserine O-succinyltransferase
MEPIRLAILDMYDNTPNQGMRCIREIIEAFPAISEYKVYDVRGRAETPDLSYDIYISTGGPGSPLEGDGHWDHRYYQWISDLWVWNAKGRGPKKHVFFICHSFQMACHFFSVGDITRRHSTSFGTFPCYITEAGAQEPIFNGLPNPFFVADFRDWQVIRPNMDRLAAIGATILALEKIRPHVPMERAVMAVRFSDEIIGTQFHPEADSAGMIQHFLDPERRRKIIAEHSEQRYYRMMEHLEDPDKIPLTHEIVLPEFLIHAIRLLRRKAVVA